ncbi:hypothetical protein ABIB42_004821 [Massilia sp. UYP32]|uniref:hypothetical protein n=1 Tax=Massilia sp. UYP32 TaxID=1756386 RepID=UPI003D1A5EE6
MQAASSNQLARMSSTFRHMRGRQVAHMLNGVTAEGIRIDHCDMTMINAYARGEVSGRDLLAHVCQFTTLTSYQEWLKTGFDRHGSSRKTSVSVEQNVAEVAAYIRRKYLKNDPTAKSGS